MDIYCEHRRFLHPGGAPTRAANHLLELVLAQHKVCGTMSWGEWKPIPDLREITQTGLGNTVFCSYTPVYTGTWEFPIIRRGKPISKALCHAYIFWDGTGIVFYRCWKYDANALDGKVHRYRGHGRAHNEMIARVYRFGCEHDYAEDNSRAVELGVAPLFSHDHLNICRKCGHFFVVDSSD